MNKSASRNPGATPSAPALCACLSVEDAALQLSIGRTSVHALIKEGHLASVKFGCRRVVPLAAIHALIERMQGISSVA